MSRFQSLPDPVEDLRHAMMQFRRSATRADLEDVKTAPGAILRMAHREMDAAGGSRRRRPPGAGAGRLSGEPIRGRRGHPGQHDSRVNRPGLNPTTEKGRHAAPQGGGCRGVRLMAADTGGAKDVPPRRRGQHPAAAPGAELQRRPTSLSRRVQVPDKPDGPLIPSGAWIRRSGGHPVGGSTPPGSASQRGRDHK